MPSISLSGGSGIANLAIVRSKFNRAAGGHLICVAAVVPRLRNPDKYCTIDLRVTPTAHSHSSLPLTMEQSAASRQGTLLIAVFLNVYLFGLVSQQFYAYWVIGFKDPIRLRLFIIVQFIIVALQSGLVWRLAYNTFVVYRNLPLGSPLLMPWEGPINSLCQLFIILTTNVYLASRIYTLTKNRLQSGVVIALSTIAFVFGIITNVTTWKMTLSQKARVETSIIWHAAQAIAECLITFFLSRVLLKSRSGVHGSDSMLNYLARGVIQTGFLATVWAVVGLATWFLLPGVAAYRIFDITSGTVYTQTMFDTLLSRVQLREHMDSLTHLEMGQSRDRRRKSSQILGRPRDTASGPLVFNFAASRLSSNDSGRGPSLTGEDPVIELKTFG
ncbi:hypothetical protein BJV74DRAFT_859920 [Russula compacta]|nr:hypothetical protein BJV74DRAFT_859920 [Russula compacta]